MTTRLEIVADWLALTRLCGYDAAQMASTCRVHLRTLELFFHEQVGITPNLWTMDVRCLDAEQKLRRGLMTKAVATDLCFSDSAHLCREIRKRYGIPPQNVFSLPNPSAHAEKIVAMLGRFRLGSRFSL